jgi:hypothetical protein
MKLCVLAAILSFSAFADSPIAPAYEAKEISFRSHVEAVLTKAGCNMGACHGAAAGKNGFYLSLRGYNPEADYIAITRNAGGRRIALSDPGRSLILMKAAAAIPHKGGKRFDVGSPEYRTLADWIASGATAPRDDDARISRLEILPSQSNLQPGATQQMTVRAYFTDGRAEDVTRWAKYTSAGETVAGVDDAGLVKVAGYGEAGIAAMYLSKVAVGAVTSPWTNHLAPDLYAKIPNRNFIDQQINEKLRRLNLLPSPPASDGEFIRRAFLDTIGVLPAPIEVREFLKDSSEEKRDRLIDRLLERPEFIDYWSYKWSDLLLVSSTKLTPRAARAYYTWIRRNIEANTPWDVMVKDLLTVQGSTIENGAGNFYALHTDARAMAETATQAFMGMSVGCAKCHNHPNERWTNDDYYALANLFARLRTKNGAGDGELILVAATAGDLVQPRTGKPQPPRPLDGKALDPNDTQDRRIALAQWIASRENPYFGKAIANRIWANFFGVGLVERVDDLRASNPASNESLFQAAADYLADHHYDLKSLMRAILRSAAYQRSSESLPENAADTRFYSRYYPRRLMAEVILDAMSQVTAVPTSFNRELRRGDEFAINYPTGARAIQLPDSLVSSYFLKSFGRPDRIQTCECERTTEPSVAQVLHMANGDTLNQKLSATNGVVESECMSKVPAGAIIEEAYLAAFSRFPTESEKSKLAEAIDKSGPADRRAAVEDLYWALLSSKEFLFNH